MLKSLSIRNYALIDSLELEFITGLNIITGETGAGKSIIVDALMLALGERASSELIREGEHKAIIEGVFELNKNHTIIELLKDNDLNTQGELLIRRELLDKGTSRCFINDTPVQLSLLKKIGDLLVDFHGQHEHQLLLKRESHISLLDILADVKDLKNDYVDSYFLLTKKTEALSQLLKSEHTLREREDALRYELGEINKIEPQFNEEADLEQELNIIQNAERLYNTTSELYELLYEGMHPESEDSGRDPSVNDKISTAIKLLEELKKIDGKFGEYLDECNKAAVTIGEISKFIKNYNSGIQFEQERIELIRERLQLLRGLRKKYGTYDAIFVRRNNLIHELELIGNFEEEIKKIRNDIRDLKNSTGQLAKELSSKRKKIALEFEKTMSMTLKLLGIENSVFRVVINQTVSKKIDRTKYEDELTVFIGENEYKAYSDGIDTVEFYISTNKGESPKPLVNVASGGEISRIMLAIKSIVAKADELPILVFDEIDIGISGRIAQKVGLTMQNLAKHHQIIAITHLPQIAALGDRNIRVVKQLSNERTHIKTNIIEGEDKIKELARLLSGEKVTETTIKAAKELTN